MFRECWQYLVTPCSSHLRQLGYLKELIGIQSRYHRSHKLWRSHLQKTKGFILEGARRCNRRRKVVILGSGWLLDIPLKSLAGMFDEVFLLDVVHPLTARRTARRFPNVKLVEKDVSGVAMDVFQLARRVRITGKKEPLSALGPSVPQSKNDIDYVVSANLLSQLPMVPVEYLRKLQDRVGGSMYKEPEIQEFTRRILEQHVQTLREGVCQSCLVADVEAITLDREDKVVEKMGLLDGLSLPPVQCEWMWEIADFGEVHANQRICHRVVGIYTISS